MRQLLTAFSLLCILVNPAAARHVTADQVAEYKTILKEYIDRRPSGMRQKLATALGKHKSFISQITGPSACTDRIDALDRPASPFGPGAPCGPCGPCGPGCP